MAMSLRSEAPKPRNPETLKTGSQGREQQQQKNANAGDKILKYIYSSGLLAGGGKLSSVFLIDGLLTLSTHIHKSGAMNKSNVGNRV